MDKPVFAIHAPEPAKLEAVKAEMRSLGPPEIRVVEYRGGFIALEGSHRLAAASELGLKPRFVFIDPASLIDISGEDWFDAHHWAETVYAAGEVAYELWSISNVRSYRF